MVIDSHTHLGAKTIIASADGLIASMDASGIDKALVFAGKLNGLSNEQLFRDIAAHQERLFAVGSVTPGSPRMPPLSDVEAWMRQGAIRALKFYPGYEYYYPYDAVIRPYLELCARRGKPAIFHSGDTYSKAHASKLKYAHPLHIDEVAVELPELKIVIAHFGYPWQNDAAEVVYKNPNVHVDCSGFVYGRFGINDETDFRKVVEDYVRVAGGLDRVLFGTDWPISDQSSYVDVARRVFNGDQKIMSGNAQTLFGI